MKNMWKVVADEVLTPLQRTKLEALAMVRMYKMVIVMTLTSEACPAHNLEVSR